MVTHIRTPERGKEKSAATATLLVHTLYIHAIYTQIGTFIYTRTYSEEGHVVEEERLSAHSSLSPSLLPMGEMNECEREKIEREREREKKNHHPAAFP